MTAAMLPDCFSHASCMSLAPLLHEPRRLPNVENARDGEGRVLSETVTGDEGRAGRRLHAEMVLHGAHGGEADGHDGRLGIRRLAQRLVGPLEQEPRERAAEGHVDLVEDGPRRA